MPQYHIYSHCCFTPKEKPYIYSVDMMMAYVTLFKPQIVQLPLEELVVQLKDNWWGDFSPMDVIEHPTKKKYATHMKRIHAADLSYPIFLTNSYGIIDGAHRISKAFLQNKKTINAYIFPPSLMKKFIIHKGFTEDGRIDEEGAQEVPLSEVLQLFYKRFYKSA